jgi:curved DNA-binding protein CbpA
MRLGKDVLEADLYGELGLLPDATESEIRVAYRQKVRVSHPDLNQTDPDAAPRMTRLNVAAKVLLDPALRRAYDRAPRGKRSSKAPRPEATARRNAAWFERNEQSTDNDWAPPPAPPRETRASFGNFFGELRGREGHFSLQVQELVESLSARQQIGVAALLFAIALGLIVMSRPVAQPDGATHSTVNLGVYP